MAVVKTFTKRLATIILLLITVPASSQLCQGSLGDPIVNITFGGGQNPGPSLSAATTNYSFAANDCPPDGSYTVRNNTNSCFNNSWHTLNSDHTGNPGGYFMLVNASVTPSAFYTDTVNLFCSNTTYEFAAWIANVLRPAACNGNGNQPNLTFTIERTDGTVIQTYNTGSITPDNTPTWKQYGFFFTTPSGVNRVVLRITNNAPGGCGNDLALDDITFRPCGPQLSAAFNSGSNQINLCQGDATQLYMNATLSAGFSNPVFQWQTSNDNVIWTDIAGANTTTLTQNFSATSASNLYYRITVAEAENIASPTCRVASPSLTVRVNSKPVVAISHNSPLCEKTNIVLSATGGSQYMWSGVQNFSATSSSVTIPNVQVNQSGKYYVEVVSDANCRSTDSVNVVVNPKPVAIVANGAVSICRGDRITLSASGGDKYQWSPATGLSSVTSPDPVASPPDTIMYRVIVSNNFACADTAEVLVNVMQKPVANAGPDRVIIEGQSVQLQGAVSDAQKFYWEPAVFINDAVSLRPIVNPPADITYVLHAQSDDCGTIRDSVRVKVYKKVFIPNSFSPNGDGVNDTWVITALEAYSNYELNVFDRYGMPVYTSRNRYTPWDGTLNGKPLPFATYYYVLHLKQVNIWLKGSVVIIK